MTGIVLCGGQSSRMGRDKGLLKTAGFNWAQLAVDKLSSLGIPVRISVNKKQYADYSKNFPEECLIQDSDFLPVKGPLLGVLSCHLVVPEEDLFVLACDMPLMQFSMLEQLYHCCQEPAPHTAFVFTNDKVSEPLCGIYKTSGLSLILSLLQAGKLVKHSMKFALEQLRVNTIEADAEQKKYLSNFNEYTDLSGI